MRSLEFSEIARLLEHSRVVEIDPKPTKELANEWALFGGHYKVHASKYPFTVLYVFARATKKGIERAQREFARTGETHVVYAASLERDFKSIRTMFSGATHVWTQREYVASFFREQLDAYRTQLEKLRPKHYVDPRVEVPAGFTRKVPNPLLPLLRGALTKAEAESGVLAVLLAEAGQGKTFTTEHLASLLAKSDRIPIYIRSAQWSSLSVDDLRSWWKTITNAFRYYGAPIGWVEGCEDEFLEVTLSAGLFCVIFDGFDEYVLRNRGEVRAQDALEALKSLAAETGASILVTSRTSFWETDVTETEDGSIAAVPGLQVFRLLPFDRASANNYFADRLSGKARSAKATDLYGKLLEQNKTLAGRGFVLSLVADLVERDASLAALPAGANLTAWLMDALCERERERQKLPLTANQQLAALRLFAAEVAAGVEPTTENLELAVSFNSDIAGPERTACIQRMKSHPLLRLVDDRWVFTQEQVRYTLLAEYLLQTFTASSARADFERFVAAVRLDAEATDAAAKTIVDVGTFGVDPSTAQQVLGTLTKNMLGVTAAPVHSTGRRLAVAVAFATVDRFYSKGETHSARLSALKSMLPGGELRDLAMTGTISRYDFSGCTFRGCRFEGVTLVNCEFDAPTEFRSCSFDALRVLRSEGFGLAVIADCSKDPNSDAMIRDEQISAGKRSYTEEDLKTDFRAALVKFSGKGGGGVRTITEGKLRAGSLGLSKYRDAILAELARDVIAEHEISGISEKGYHVQDAAVQAVRFFLENNVMTGPLRSAFDRLKKKLGQ